MAEYSAVTIREALLRVSGASRTDARLLLAHVLGREPEYLVREPERLLTAGEWMAFEKLSARRAAGEPLQQITGIQEFWSLEFRVDSRALIPRPETEHLVEAALERIPQGADTDILDLCTGSGIVAAVLAKERPRAAVTATDISADALGLAAENLARLGLEDRVRLLRGDLFEPLGPPRRDFDLVTANPPYISQDELAGLAPEVRDHEPLLALDGGPDGLDLVRRIVDEAPAWLRPGGRLLMELGAGQWATVEKLAREGGGWGKPDWVKDLAGYRRVCCLPAEMK